MQAANVKVKSEKVLFLNMDNDCIEAICKWLPLNDLCTFSLTCRRVNALANQFFYRQFQNHRIEITNETCGPQIRTKDSYAKCFTSNIRNVRLSSVYVNFKPMRLFTFLRLNCCENLSELEFDSIYLKSKPSYGEQIQMQLNNLTTISFINCTTCDIYNEILCYCIRLRHLVVKEEAPIRMDCTWMHHKYSHLETFVYHAAEHFNVTPLTEFFQLNAHIKNVACTPNRILNILNAQPNIALDHLILRIEHATILTAYFKVLTSLAQQHRIKCLKLDFGWDVIFSPELANQLEVLSSVTTLDGLSFALKELHRSYYPIVHRRFDHVTSLNLEVARPIADAIFHRLPINVPNLQAIHLLPWHSKFIDSFEHSIGILAAYLKHLKIIAIYQINVNVISPKSIAQMHTWRKKLHTACPLTIYLPYEITENITFIIPVGSLVTVKPISSLKRDIYSYERRDI